MRIRIALLAAMAVFSASAQETRSATRLTNDHYFDFERVSSPQISPDGARIVYTRQQANKIEDRWDSALWIMNADGSQHRFLAKGGNPRWSSDGKRILYVAEGEPRGPQIFVRWIDTDGPATQVTHATDKVADARWSPDGKWIAFSMFVPQKDTWTISMPTAPQGAHWTAAPRVVDSLHYRQDQVGFLEDGHNHLFVVSAEGGAPRQLTNGKWSVGAGELRAAVPMDWTPDSKSIVFEADRTAGADLHYQTSQLLVADIATGAIRDLVAKPGNWGRPTVSPDGRSVAFTGYPQSNRTHSVADLYVIPFAGGEMRKISGDYDRDPLNLRWSPDSTGLYFDADDHGSRNIQYAAVSGGPVKPVTTGVHVLTIDSASSDLIAVGTMTDPDNPPDVVRYNLHRPAEITRLTNVNAGLLAGKHLAKTEEINFTSSGSAKVQGWMVKPPDFDPAKKYPLILEIHGGPFSMYSVAFNYMFQNFAANDFVVLYPQSARQHRLRHRLLRRHRSQLSRPRLRRPDGRRRRHHSQRLRRYLAHVCLRLQRRRRALQLGDRPHRSLRRRRRALPGDRLAEYDWKHGYPALHLQLLPKAVLGRSQPVALALLRDVGRQGDHAHAADDRRAGSPHADAADRGILRCAQSSRRAREAPAIRGRVPRHRVEAFELHPHPALHDELVQEVPAHRRGQECNPGSPLAQRAATGIRAATVRERCLTASSPRPPSSPAHCAAPGPRTGLRLPTPAR